MDTDDRRPGAATSVGPWSETRDERRRALRLPTHTAAVGLVAVLLTLTAFSVAATVTNAHVAAQSQESARVSEASMAAERSLVLQEELFEQMETEPDPDPELRAAYDAAGAATRVAIEELAGVDGAGHDAEVDEWLRLHESYRSAVDELLVVAAEDPEHAEEFEEAHVDPSFEALESLLRQEAEEHFEEARASLASLGDVQDLMIVATPAGFGVGLVLVAWFTAVLTHSRREVAAQAERNRQQALHDALTGLPNRTLLRQRVTEALAGADGAALMLIDLDRFKDINDTLGHAYGDVVLQVVSTRLQKAVRATDTVARLGGDEFAILLPSTADPDDARELATRALAAMEAPIEVDGVSLDVDASIGIALSGVHGDDVESLLRGADIAMYTAKDRGLGVCVFDADLDDHSVERLGLLGQLRRAIDNRELVLHFQPKVALPGGRLCGVEALVRWQHPERGLLPPGEFIPLAERTPLIRPLTRYVIDAALEQGARWRDAGLSLGVAVNVSVPNLVDERFVDEVRELLDRWRLPASALELEVTESAIMADPDRARRVLGRLAECDVTLSIDDFGAGFTSLAHLKDLPVHQLKIDRSFVARMAVDPRSALIVRSVVELGHNLGLTTVAEGVEDQRTWDRLEELGCDVAQGWLVCRALPADGLEAWLDASGHSVVPELAAAGTATA
ncbi:diguanylate cyclase (GGDEF)-like protein [Geodermatophilus bullaregiensis]|uniref:putative bifunctional diguanylate cyclase/phosphodiesterase n=1 Tax=Geodermatophilus bullaregiensis TaxID=1564160 RepID=UPI00195D4F08|nr:EAL domain-containing protein [Geodermatophilus bullaregiensis]MBM7807849.1 diguanylate cyclase (GGDEF)-like protein [Geodermatophilus bullaregiensis]